jgi:hypothetical protein
MVKEVCWGCKKMRNDVELCATNDRLCQQCYRKNEEELAALQHGNDAASEGSKTTKKSSTKRMGKKTGKGALESLDDTNDEAISKPTTVEETDEIALLRQTIKLQQHEIKTLQDRLAYVLSYLGIDDLELEDAALESLNPSDHNNYDAEENNDESSGNNHNDAIHVTSDNAGCSASFETVSRENSHRQNNNKFQQSMIAAVYMDQSLKQHRQSSLIISGLAPSITTSDAEQFKLMCNVEFNIQPNVITTKRLGRQQQDKIQPLLVVLQQVDHAQQLIANARQLRRSQNDAVRAGVYINPNLTRAESEAAYRVRVQRQEASKRRSNQPVQQPQQSQSQGSTDQPRNDNIAMSPMTEAAGDVNNISTSGRRS